MPGEEKPNRDQEKKRPPLMSRFIMFSAILFFFILVAGSITFMFSMRQIIRTNKESELSQLLEIKRIKLETAVEGEISIALMIADSPLIRNFFTDPANPDFKQIAFDELRAYRHAFEAKTIFWVSDVDRSFHFNDDDPYILDPEIPDNYWYKMTLYETDVYNFNINYNPDLNVTNLWINAPVFDENGKPLGMIGTGIDLSTFLDMIYEDHYDGVAIYFFNTAGEITGADDVGLVGDKTSIADELDFIGVDIVSEAKTLLPGATMTMDFPSGKIALSSIPLLEWYSAAVFSYSINDYDSAMTVFFILTLIVLLLVLVIFNVFIAKLLKPMRISMEEAYAANLAKSEFLSTMSHEIRTPLNAILGITEIQLQRDTLDSDVRDGLEKVFVSGDMLLSIINDILDLSKIESDRLELTPYPYEVAGLIGDTVQLNIMRIGSKAIEFNLHVDEDMPSMLNGDELRIKQILNNLLSNAFKYTSRGTVKMSVYTEPVEGADTEVTLVVVVSDTGQGMTKEQVDKLFDAFSRFNLDVNRTTEGTGLGMSITRNLIHMMHGNIEIESEPGKGSVFTIRLPQGIASTELLGKEMADSLRKFRSGGKSHLRRAHIAYEPMPYGSVLIVDDVETNLFVAEGLMSPYDLRIETADSGFGAIELIGGGKVYDVVFMDHMMPKMDGIETTRRLRAMGYTQPIVALTANAVAGQSDIFLGNGFDDFISKPIDIRHLNAMLNKYIRDKQPPEVIEEARAQSAAKKESPPETTVKPAVSRRFADIFLRDASRSIAVLDEFVKKDGVYSEEDMRAFIIHTHGMKSVLANMGRADISAAAMKLETLGRDNDTEIIAAETPAFLSMLKAYAEELTPKEEKPADDEVAADVADDMQSLGEMLAKIKAACGQYDENAIEAFLAELRKTTWSQRVMDLLDRIEEHLLHSGFEEIADEIDMFPGL